MSWTSWWVLFCFWWAKSLRFGVANRSVSIRQASPYCLFCQCVYRSILFFVANFLGLVGGIACMGTSLQTNAASSFLVEPYSSHVIPNLLILIINNAFQTSNGFLRETNSLARPAFPSSATLFTFCSWRRRREFIMQQTVRVNDGIITLNEDTSSKLRRRTDNRLQYIHSM